MPVPPYTCPMVVPFHVPPTTVPTSICVVARFTMLDVAVVDVAVIVPAVSLPILEDAR